MFPIYYLFYLSTIAAGFVAGLLRHKHSNGVRPVVWLLGVTLCSEILSRILAYTIRNNIVLYHCYHPVQLTFWAWFFHVHLRGNHKRTVVPITMILVTGGILNSVFVQGLRELPGNFIKLECIVLIYWNIVLFLQFLDRPSKEAIFQNSVFIISISCLWYNLISYVYFAFQHAYAFTPSMLLVISRIHFVSNYVYYILLFYALCLKENLIYEEQ